MPTDHPLKIHNENIIISPFVITLYITVVLTSLVLTNKLFVWHNMVFSACLITFPLLYFFGDIVAEIYGFKAASNLIKYTILSSILFSIICTFTIKIPSASFHNNGQAYNEVLGQNLKFSIGGVLAIFVGLYANAYIISKLNIIMSGKYFGLRSIVASSIGEFVNSLVAIPIGFLGQIPNNELLNMLIVTYFFKIAYAVVAAIPASMIINYVKNIRAKNNVNARYQFSVKYNPF